MSVEAVAVKYAALNLKRCSAETRRAVQKAQPLEQEAPGSIHAAVVGPPVLEAVPAVVPEQIEPLGGGNVPVTPFLQWVSIWVGAHR